LFLAHDPCMHSLLMHAFCNLQFKGSLYVAIFPPRPFVRTIIIRGFCEISFV
jgi:hypothetical protein